MEMAGDYKGSYVCIAKPSSDQVCTAHQAAMRQQNAGCSHPTMSPKTSHDFPNSEGVPQKYELFFGPHN